MSDDDDGASIGAEAGMSAGIELAGVASDGLDDVLATGDGTVGTIFTSMSARHPEGADAGYLAWHTLDHRPEQYRLDSLRGSLRLVSTPRCRAARAASRGRFDPVDHVMVYLFTDVGGIEGFYELGRALGAGGRMPHLLPPVQRGAYEVDARHAATRVKIGADVLPWYPATGVYLLVEQGEGPDLGDLVATPGVVGAWSARATPMDLADGQGGIDEDERITFLFLDDDPAATGERLRPALEKRWGAMGVDGQLAAPFHLVVPHEWDRYLP